jgi:hypothetical protein
MEQQPSAPDEQQPKPPSQPALAVDLRDSYVSLCVSPGFEVVAQHMRNQRNIALFMAQFMEEFSVLQVEFAKKCFQLCEGSNALFQRSFVQKAWLGIKSIGQSNEALVEVGTTHTAWQSVRETVCSTAQGHAELGGVARDGIAGSLLAYLKETEEQAAKVEAWGVRLTEAMNNYVKKAEDAKSVYHSKARGARMASKILEEAEKQVVIGGITRGIILTTSRMDKMKEAAEKAKEEELESAKEYRVALDLVNLIQLLF